MKRLLPALAALSALLLAVSKFGETPIAPGYATGFGSSANCREPQALCFETDAGDIAALVDLTVRQPGGSIEPWIAELSDGTRLSTVPARVSTDTWRVRIATPDTSLRWKKFVWQSGAVLILRNRSVHRPTLLDWSVYPEKGSRDSKARARWRQTWFVICLVCFLVSAVAVVVGQFTRQPPTPELRDEVFALIRAVIAEVEGSSEGETRQIRELLDDVLLRGVPVTQALERVASGASAVVRQRLFFRARAKFRDHWTTLLGLLNDYLDLLGH
jgi:hypothetical protein